VVDPQKPDPDAFWCPECRAHGKCNRKTIEIERGQGGYRTSTTLYCAECEVEGDIPQQVRKNIRFAAMILLGGGMVFFAVQLGIGISEGFSQDTLILTVSSLPVAAVLWYCLQRKNIFLLMKWKKWAKERGWEEE
jgi:hypothetical protein